MAALGLLLGPLACSSHISAPNSPAPVNPPTSTPTSSPMASATSTATGSPSATATCTPTGSATMTPLSTATYTPTGSPTHTATSSATATPTNTPLHTSTPCYTVTVTFTGTVPPNPTYVIQGTVNYSGTGAVDNQHLVFVGFGDAVGMDPGGFYVANTNGPYYLGLAGYFTLPRTISVQAYYDTNGLTSTTPNHYLGFGHVPGMRYTTSGSCANPASPAYTAVTVPLGTTPGTTVVGPAVALDDTCSYWGIYGTVTYTGSLGIVQDCQEVYVQFYSDAGYTAQVQSQGYFPNGSAYYVTTNDYITTGLAPLYARAFYDRAGTGALGAGDPYVNLGALTPTTDGLQENISFGDATIK